MRAIALWHSSTHWRQSTARVSTLHSVRIVIGNGGEREREREEICQSWGHFKFHLVKRSLPSSLQLGGLFNSPLLVSRRGGGTCFDEPRRLIAPPGIHFHSVFSGYSAAAEARLRNFGHIVRVKHEFLKRLFPLTQREPHVDDR